MNYKEYGKTGKQVSTIGFGAMRFEEPENTEKSVQTVLKAFELGINYFDTAPGYCNDLSEINVGHAVKKMKKSGKPFYVSTKSSKADGKELREQLENSLKRLNLDTIDFFHCWYVLTLDEWEKRKAGGAVDAILKAREEGLIRHAVFSTHLPGPDIRKVVEENYFEGVTLGYSAINFPYREKGVQAAFEHNMGVVVMNPLGGGLIPANEDSFDFLKIREGQNILDGALHFLMSDPRITVSLVGFRNEEDVETAVQSVERGESNLYNDREIEFLRNKINTDLNNLCTSCMYCDGCPEGITPWKYMETANLLYLNALQPLSSRLQLHWGADIKALENCTECRECEEKCTQHLPILERFELLKKKVKEEKA